MRKFWKRGQRFLNLPVSKGIGDAQTLFVNPKAIDAFCRFDDAHTLISVNGKIYKVEITIEKFILKIRSYD